MENYGLTKEEKVSVADKIKRRERLMAVLVNVKSISFTYANGDISLKPIFENEEDFTDELGEFIIGYLNQEAMASIGAFIDMSKKIV